MTKSESATKIIPNFPDPQKLTSAWLNIFKNGADALQSTASRTASKVAPLPYDPKAASRAFNSFVATFFRRP